MMTRTPQNISLTTTSTFIAFSFASNHFCQQSVEKALKAVYYEKYDKTPPRKHDLVALAAAADIFSDLDDARKGLFVALSHRTTPKSLTA
jgi:HEPN domain-containing protein